MLDMLMCAFLAQMWSKQNKQTLLCEICYTYTYMNVCGEGKGGCKSPRYITLVHYYFCILSNVIFKGFFFFFLPIRATPTTHKSFFVCLPSVEPCSPYLPWQHQTQAAVPSPNTQCTARPRGMLPLAHRVLLLPLCFFRSVSSMQAATTCHLLGTLAYPSCIPAMLLDSIRNVLPGCGDFYLHFTHLALLHTFLPLRHDKGRKRSISCQGGWMAPLEEYAFEAICSASLT